MSEHDIEYQLRDRIAWITINRPERRNALTRHNMSVDLPDTWLRFEADEEARIAIISGAGEFAFCAGMDVKERAGAFERSADGGASEQTRETRVSPRANGVTKPVIGAVNGVCTGVGMQIVADCDLLIASENAWFSDARTSVGLVPALGASELARAMPPHEAAEQLARTVMRNAPHAVRLAKQAVWESLDGGLADGMANARALAAANPTLEDVREGARAFVERRDPDWKLR